MKDKKKYFEIVNFINAREVDSDDKDIFAIRKERFLINAKTIGFIFTFAWSTVFLYCIFITPLTESQLAMKFSPDEMYLYWLMYIQTFVSTVISSGLGVAGHFIATLMYFMSLEFKILSIRFGKVLDDIEDDMTEEKSRKTMIDLKSSIKHYQRTLM